MSVPSSDVIYESIIALQINIVKMSRTTMAFVFTGIIATTKIWSDMSDDNSYTSTMGIVISLFNVLIITAGLFSEMWLREEQKHLKKRMEDIKPAINVLEMDNPFKILWLGTSSWIIIIYSVMFVFWFIVSIYLFIQ